MKKLLYLFKTFILIGLTSFGGYMALISMMRNKMVMRDKCIDDSIITEGISLASMLPGPVAVNVVAYTGFYIAGVLGAVVSVIAVLIPSFVLVIVLTLLYFQTGSKVYFDSTFFGIIPVVVGIIFSVGVSMARKTCTTFVHYAITTLSFVMLFFLKGYWAIVLILVSSALLGVLFLKSEMPSISVSKNGSWKPVVLSLMIYGTILLAIGVFSPESVLTSLFSQFSYISLTLFGGGYVMIPVLKSLLVDQLTWFNDNEFMYGISIGQITPGPILISAVFFGYKMAGIAGSIVATIGIFLPSAILMIILSKIFISLKHNKIVQSALSGLKPAVTGMIMYSGFSIFLQHVPGANLFVSFALTAISFWLIFKLNVASVLVIILGGMIGFMLY